MEGLLRESSHAIEERMEYVIRNAALIAAAQRVEHYEIAGYGCVRAHATILGDDIAAALLAQTLAEEEEADKTLKAIAERLNLEIARERNQSEALTLSQRSMSSVI